MNTEQSRNIRHVLHVEAEQKHTSSATGGNPALNQIHMLVRWYFRAFLRFPESQTWPHRPTYVIITVMSNLISTSDSHLPA